MPLRRPAHDSLLKRVATKALWPDQGQTTCRHRLAAFPWVLVQSRWGQWLDVAERRMSPYLGASHDHFGENTYICTFVTGVTSELRRVQCKLSHKRCSSRVFLV
eukprot:1888190-Amphidinium_carterae.1